MAADLLKDTFEDGALQKKYHNYMTPAAKITIGGSELSSCTGARMESVRVSLNLEAAASADFSVTDIWDEGQGSIKAAVKTNLSCGKTVKIELGYDSEYVDVFHGFIYETSVQFSEMPTMQVTAMDVKRLMADNMRLGTSWSGKTVTEIYETLMNGYTGLGLEVSSDYQGEGGAGELIQRGSDLSLVQKLCRKFNLRFIVCGKQAKLTGKSEDASVTTLSWGRDLISFSQSTTHVNVKVVVKGTLKKKTQRSQAQGGQSQGSAPQGKGSEQEKEKEVSLEKTGTVSSTQAAGGICQTVKIIEMTNVSSAAELEDRLADEIESLKEGMHAGRGSCMGMPVLIPGRYIKIAGLDGSMNGEYYLKAVNHSFGADGFTTDFTLGGKK